MPPIAYWYMCLHRSLFLYIKPLNWNQKVSSTHSNSTSHTYKPPTSVIVLFQVHTTNQTHFCHRLKINFDNKIKIKFECGDATSWLQDNKCFIYKSELLYIVMEWYITIPILLLSFLEMMVDSQNILLN